MKSKLKEWLQQRGCYITIFVMFFFFLDIVSTAVATRLAGGRFELNLLVSSLIQAGNWPMLIIAKAAGTIILLGGFYYLYNKGHDNTKEMKLCLQVNGENRYYQISIPDSHMQWYEALCWGILLTISVFIVLLNFMTVIFLLP